MLFFFNDTATTEIYTLSLHDALPISPPVSVIKPVKGVDQSASGNFRGFCEQDYPSDYEIVFCVEGRDDPARKSTRLNSSHANISYAVFCLKKKRQRRGYHPPTPRWHH